MHVVLVRWKPDVSPTEMQQLSDSARTFPDTISGVLAVHCGPSSSPEGLEGGFDWALIVGFADGAARDAYLPHPQHQPVAQQISELAEHVVVFDVDG